MPTFDFKKALPQAFPTLDAKQIAIIAEYAERKTYKDGDVLASKFSLQRNRKFSVCCSMNFSTNCFFH